MIRNTLTCCRRSFPVVNDHLKVYSPADCVSCVHHGVGVLLIACHDTIGVRRAIIVVKRLSHMVSRVRGASGRASNLRTVSSTVWSRVRSGGGVGRAIHEPPRV